MPPTFFSDEGTPAVIDLSDVLGALADRNPRLRDDAAARLGDLLYAKTFDPATARSVTERLVALAVAEPDEVVRESALNSIGEAMCHYRIPLELVEPLAPGLGRMPRTQLEHALFILGATQDRRAQQFIAPFIGHTDGRVRADAELALGELGLSPHPDQPSA